MEVGVSKGREREPGRMANRVCGILHEGNLELKSRDEWLPIRDVNRASGEETTNTLRQMNRHLQYLENDLCPLHHG